MANQRSLHDSFTARTRIKESSDRSFGLIVGIALAIIGGVRFHLHALTAIEIGLFAAALLLIITGLVAPRLLRPANKAWLKFGRLLFMISNPVMMALIFFISFVPVGLIMRLAGKDILRLKFDARAETYWLDRNPPGPAPEMMKFQF
jgi:cell division protein FtsW (lipid II flippase)